MGSGDCSTSEGTLQMPQFSHPRCWARERRENYDTRESLRCTTRDKANYSQGSRSGVSESDSENDRYVSGSDSESDKYVSGSDFENAFVSSHLQSLETPAW